MYYLKRISIMLLHKVSRGRMNPKDPQSSLEIC